MTHSRTRSDAFVGEAGRPCAVVMPHDGGGTEVYTDALLGAGVDVLRFDAADGGARARIAGCRAAIGHARTLDGVDPDRIVVWGASLSGGLALGAAADDGRVAAVVALFPLVDVAAALISGRRAALERLAAIGVHRQLLVELTALRPGRRAKDLTCPVLFQVADFDETVPPQSVMAAAWEASGHARVRHYPCDHADAFTPGEWPAPIAAHQVAFLETVFTEAPEPIVA